LSTLAIGLAAPTLLSSSVELLPTETWLLLVFPPVTTLLVEIDPGPEAMAPVIAPTLVPASLPANVTVNVLVVEVAVCVTNTNPPAPPMLDRPLSAACMVAASFTVAEKVMLDVVTVPNVSLKEVADVAPLSAMDCTEEVLGPPSALAAW